MDMTKMGPMSRKVTKEDKKGVEAFYKSWQEAWKKSDINAVADMVSFPVTMISDHADGRGDAVMMSREEWIKEMEPMVKNPPPANMQVHTKLTHIAFLSDTLASVHEETTMTMGKEKHKWAGASMLNMQDGKWKVLMMAEAGWADVMGPKKDMATHGSNTGTAPMPASQTGMPAKKQ
jgi:uncharacterized protein (TIGR02246 family)